jgi:hypothetical protein
MSLIWMVMQGGYVTPQMFGFLNCIAFHKH